VIEKFLCVESWQALLPKFIQNKKHLQQCATVCENITSVWSGLKYGVQKDKYIAHNVVEAVVVLVGGV
jgi:hypothetical protein